MKNIGTALKALDELLDQVHELDDWPEDVDEAEVARKIEEFTDYLDEKLFEAGR